MTGTTPKSALKSGEKALRDNVPSKGGSDRKEVPVNLATSCAIFEIDRER